MEFCTKNDFIRCLSGCIIDTSNVSKRKFRCQGRTIVSSVVQKLLPATGNVLILGFNLAISPRQECRSGSQRDSQFFCPIYEFGINKGSTSVVHGRLRISKGMYPFFNSRDCSLSTSVSNGV